MSAVSDTLVNHLLTCSLVRFRLTVDFGLLRTCLSIALISLAIDLGFWSDVELAT